MKFTVTDESVNSYGFWLKTSGGEIESFLKNPIMLWNHIRSWGSKTDILPIGKWEHLKKEGYTMTAESVFDEKDEFAQQIKSKVEQGVLSAVSVGIRILAVSERPEDLKPGQTRPTVTHWVLREISVCDIPSNGNAVAIALYDDKDQMINLSDGDQDILPLLKNLKNENMNFDDVKKELGLSASGTEAEVLSAVQKLKKSEGEAQVQLTKQQDAALSALISDAIKAGKTTEGKRETYMSIGRNQGVEALQEILADLSTGVRPSQVINPKANGFMPQKWADLSDKDREELRKSDQGTYRKLFSQEYGFEPEI